MSLIHCPDDVKLEAVQVRVSFVVLATAVVSLSVCVLVFNSSDTFRIKVYSSGEKHVATVFVNDKLSLLCSPGHF